jgi:hypothetical protein
VDDKPIHLRLGERVARLEGHHKRSPPGSCDWAPDRCWVGSLSDAIFRQRLGGGPRLRADAAQCASSLPQSQSTRHAPPQPFEGENAPPASGRRFPRPAKPICRLSNNQRDSRRKSDVLAAELEFPTCIQRTLARQQLTAYRFLGVPYRNAKPCVCYFRWYGAKKTRSSISDLICVHHCCSRTPITLNFPFRPIGQDRSPTGTTSPPASRCLLLCCHFTIQECSSQPCQASNPNLHP